MKIESRPQRCECGEPLPEGPWQRKRIYCSEKCHQRFWNRKRRARMTAEEKSAERRRQKELHSRDGRKRGDSIKYRTAVYIRDKGQCKLCGKELPPYPWDPRRNTGFTLDHIDPTKGTFEANLQLACSPCNARKQRSSGSGN